MSVYATLVMGADGSTSLLGNSDGITSPQDRQRFLTNRRKSDVILVGGNTARHERYRRTPVPLVIISHTHPDIVGENPRAHWWNLSPLEAVKKASSDFGSSVFVEGGISMIRELLDAGAIDQFDLSITPTTGGENREDPSVLLAHFKKVVKSELGGTTFYSCTEPITSIMWQK